MPIKKLALVAAAGGAAAALAAAPSGAQTPPTSKGCSQRPYRSHGNFTARLHAPGHKPNSWHKVHDSDTGKRAWLALWRIRVTASRGGHPIAGRVTYQFLFNGRIVACRNVQPPYHPRFNGTFHDVIQWPERSIGIPLTFRAVVITKYGVKNLNYSVIVQQRKKR